LRNFLPYTEVFTPILTQDRSISNICLPCRPQATDTLNLSVQNSPSLTGPTRLPVAPLQPGQEPDPKARWSSGRIVLPATQPLASSSPSALLLQPERDPEAMKKTCARCVNARQVMFPAKQLMRMCLRPKPQASTLKLVFGPRPRSLTPHTTTNEENDVIRPQI
jgi:hypothetical protein